MVPETRYARLGDLHVAFQTLGEGAVDLVLSDQWFSHMDGQWDVPPLAEFRRRLATFSRLIMFDRRGVGLSDPVPISALPPLETWMDDMVGVMDTVGSQRAALVTNIGGALTSLVFAAAHPDRVGSLVVVDGFARFLEDTDYPIGAPVAEMERQVAAMETAWGRGMMLDLFAPGIRAVPGLRETWARFERQAASPGAAQAMVRNILQMDVRHVLPAIRVPTLVIQHPEGAVFPPAFGRYIAEQIAGARYVELPGPDQLIWAGDQAATVAEIEEFVTGARPMPKAERVLATVLFTDIVRSTERAAELGDRAWRELLEAHDGLARAAVAAGGGRLVKGTGDGLLATFDGPARAVLAAAAIRDRVGELGLQVRAGLHAGEIELGAGDVAGLAVHIGSRVAGLAEPGEILVTGTVRDLVVGSSIAFDDRGSRILRGVPGRWRLYAAALAPGTA